jgi:hypothetical protein
LWACLAVLRGTKEVIGDIFTRVAENDPDLLIVDCPAVAQATRDYDEYLEMLSQQGGPELRLSGIGPYGNGKMIAKLTGNLPLLR